MSSRRSRNGGIWMVEVSNRWRSALENVPARALARRVGSGGNDEPKGRRPSHGVLKRGLIPRTQVFRAAQIETPRPGTGCLGGELPPATPQSGEDGTQSRCQARCLECEERQRRPPPEAVNEFRGQAPAAARLADDQDRAVGKGGRDDRATDAGGLGRASDPVLEAGRGAELVPQDAVLTQKSPIPDLRFERGQQRLPLDWNGHHPGASGAEPGELRPGGIGRGEHDRRRIGTQPVQVFDRRLHFFGRRRRVHDHRRGVPEELLRRFVENRGQPPDLPRCLGQEPGRLASRLAVPDHYRDLVAYARRRIRDQGGCGEGHGDTGEPGPPSSLIPPSA